MKIALKLLQNKPSAFVHQKLNSLPSDLQVNKCFLVYQPVCPSLSHSRFCGTAIKLRAKHFIFYFIFSCFWTVFTSNVAFLFTWIVVVFYCIFLYFFCLFILLSVYSVADGLFVYLTASLFVGMWIRFLQKKNWSEALFQRPSFFQIFCETFRIHPPEKKPGTRNRIPSLYFFQNRVRDYSREKERERNTRNCGQRIRWARSD